jgi:prolycopene isomerase
MKILSYQTVGAFGFLVVITIMTGLSGCRDQTQVQPEASHISDTTQPMYAITSATPGKNKRQLGEEHQGYKSAECLSCHEGAHDAAAYRPSDCAGCHGGNGAPLRAADHPNADCARCHKDVHAAEAFASPHECTSCHLYRAPPQACTTQENYDVVIIGAGGGGLAAGAVLSRAGLKVLMVERNKRVGGYMANYRRGKFRFEASLHGFDGLDPTYGMNASVFKELGIADMVKPIRAEPVIFRVITARKSYDVPSDIKRFEAMLKAEFPAEQRNIARLFKDIMDLGRIVNKVARAPKNWLGLPKGATPLELARIYWVSNEPASRYMSNFLRDPELISVLGQFIGFVAVPLDRMSALMASYILYTYHAGGSYYFEGGSQAISDALASVITRQGGTIRLNETVTKIQLTGSKATGVKTSGGSCYQGRYVISNANARATMLELVGRQHLPEDYTARLEKMSPSISAFVINLGIDQDLSSQFGTTHEIMVAARGGVSDIRAAERCGLSSVAYAIGNYSMIDPTMSPPGTTSLMMTAAFGYECFERWGYRSAVKTPLQVKKEIAESFIGRLNEMFPGVRDHIVVADIITPVTLQQYTLSPSGAFNGFAYTMEQSLMKRLAPTTPIANLYLAGAWTVPGGGQSAVLMSGATAAQLILEQEGKE